MIQCIIDHQNIWILFGLILYIPVNNVSVMLGRVLVGLTSTMQQIKSHNTVTLPAVRLEPANLPSQSSHIT